MESNEAEKRNSGASVISVIIGITLLIALALIALSVAIYRGELVVSLEPSKNPFDKARRFYESGEYVRTLRTLNEANVEQNTKEAYQVYLLMGMAYDAMGKYHDAINIYESIVEYPLTDVNLFYNMGLTYLRLGMASDAIRSFEIALSVKPNHLPTLLALGNFYYERYLYRLARSYYNRVLEVEHSNEVAKLHIGLIALKYRETSVAYGIFSNLMSSENANIGATASAILGDKYLKEDNIEVAEQMYLRSLAYNIKQPGVANTLADLYNVISDQDGVIGIYKQIVRIDPRNVEALKKLGYMYAENKDYEEAIFYYKKLLAVSEDKYHPTALIADMCYKAKKYNDAEKYYMKIIGTGKKGEAYKRALFCLGEISVHKENYKKAFTYYEKGLRENPNDFIFLGRIGALYLREGDANNGIGMITKSWIGDKTDSSAMITLGKYYEKDNKYKEALSVYKEIEKQFPNDKEVIYRIGKIYHEQKDYEASKKYLTATATNALNKDIVKADAFLMLAKEADIAREYGIAIRYFENSINTYPSIQNCYNYGLFLYKSKKYENAIVVFEKALEYKPGRKEALSINMALGRAYDKVSKYEDALSAYIRALKGDRNNIEASARVKTLKTMK